MNDPSGAEDTDLKTHTRQIAGSDRAEAIAAPAKAEGRAPDTLLRILAVPGTNIAPTLRVEWLADGVPYSGWLLDPDGGVVARLQAFRFDFVHFQPAREAMLARACAGPAEINPAPTMVSLDLRSSRIEAEGDWYWLADWLFGNNGHQPGQKLRIRTTARRIDLRFHAHPWSGIVKVSLDGATFAEIDLFNPSTGVPRSCLVENSSGGLAIVEIELTGRRAGEAQGGQCFLEGIFEDIGPSSVPHHGKMRPVNRGGRFPDQLTRALAELPADATLLDVGGGRRQIDDPRYLNLEYTAYDEADLLGDALALPFRDDSIDFIYSSAVMEHLRDPHRFGHELWRILKPGGRILVNSAFMQPIHSEGMHFFNATPYAMDLVFERFVERRVWWEGSLSDTIDWMFRVAGVTARADKAELAGVMEALSRFDHLVTYEKLMYVASGVWLSGHKPHADT
jgi:SAM-dependent methyltransferase